MGFLPLLDSIVNFCCVLHYAAKAAGVKPCNAPFFCGHIPEHPQVERLLGDHLLQLGIPALQFAQPSNTGDGHPAILVAPPILRLFGAMMLAADRPHVVRSVSFPQNPNDLLLRKLLPLHVGLLLLDSSLTQQLVPFPEGRSSAPSRSSEDTSSRACSGM
jgi:hypothetical protein